MKLLICVLPCSLTSEDYQLLAPGFGSTETECEEAQPPHCWEMLLSKVTPMAKQSPVTDGLAQGTGLSRLSCALFNCKKTARYSTAINFLDFPAFLSFFWWRHDFGYWLGGEVKLQSIAMAAVTEMKIHLILVSLWSYQRRRAEKKWGYLCVKSRFMSPSPVWGSDFLKWTTNLSGAAHMLFSNHCT